MNAKTRPDSYRVPALEESMSAEAVEAMEARLLEAFAAHHRPAAPHWRYWVVAAAAMVLIGVGLSGWRGRHDVPRPPSTSSAPAVAPAAVTAERSPVAAVPPRESRPVRSRPFIRGAVRRRPVTTVDPQPAPAAFVALPGAIGLPRFESGSIVRLDLPLSSLAAYGIDISAAGGTSPVATDVLVGQDGEARAIRLVTTSSIVPSR